MVRVGTSIAVAAGVSAIVAGVITAGSRGADRDKTPQPAARTAATTPDSGMCPGLTPQWSVTATDPEVVQKAIAALYERVRAYSNGEFCTDHDDSGATTVFLDDSAFFADGANMMEPITVARVLKDESTCGRETADGSVGQILDTQPGGATCVEFARPVLTLDGHVTSAAVAQQRGPGAKGDTWSVEISLDDVAKRTWTDLTTAVTIASSSSTSAHAVVITQGGDVLGLLHLTRPINDGTVSVMPTGGFTKEKADLYVKLLLAPARPADATIQMLQRPGPTHA
jgi:hypothetical protein